MTLAIAVKRLHDRNKSGRWLWLFYVMPMLLNFAAASVDARSIQGISIAALSWIISLWGLIEMGFIRGTRGANIYGEDPLDR